MGFRDEREAARVRIDALERELASLRRPRVRPRFTPERALAVIVVCAAVIGAVVTVTESRVRMNEEHAAERARYDRALSDANSAYERERAEAERLRAERESESARARGEDLADVSRWYLEAREPRTASWFGHVFERVGDAPPGIGATCRITIREGEDRSVHRAPPCAVTVVCDDRQIYPLDDDLTTHVCAFGYRDSMVTVRSTQSAGRRVRARDGVVRIDDGATATWSFAFDRSPEPPP